MYDNEYILEQYDVYEYLLYIQFNVNFIIVFQQILNVV